MALTRYRPTKETVAARQEQRGGFFDSVFHPDVKVYKPRDGKNLVRILPRSEPEGVENKHFGMDVFIHRNIGPDNASYLCLLKHKGEPCPCCDLRRDLMEQGDPEIAKTVGWKKSVAYWVIDRNSEDDGVQLLLWGYTYDEELSVASEDPTHGNVLDITHEDHGYDVAYRRGTEKPFPKTTAITIARDESPLCDDMKWQNKWLDYVEDHPLSTILNYYPDEYISKVIKGRRTDDEGGRDKDRGSGSDRDERSRGRDEEPRERSRGRDRDEPRERSRNIDDDPPRRGRDKDPEPERGRSRDDEPHERERGSTRDDEPRGRDRDDPPPRRRQERLEEEPSSKGGDSAEASGKEQLDRLARESRERDRSRDDDRPRERSSSRDDEPRERSRGRDRDDADPPPRRASGRGDDDREVDPPRRASGRGDDRAVDADPPPRRRSREERP